MFYISYPQRLAGSQRQIITLLCNLDRNRYEPIVVLPFPGIVGPFLESRGIPVEIIEPRGLMAAYGKKVLNNGKLVNLARGAGSYLSYSFKIRNFIRDRAIDLVHSAEARATLMIGPGVRLSGRKMIAHFQGEFTVPSTNYIVRLCKVLPNASICNAEFVRQSIFGESDCPSIQTIYTGIEKPIACSPRCISTWIERRKADGFVFIGCFASVVPFKGYHILLEAVRQLKGKTRNKFIVIGVGDFPEGHEWYHSMLFQRMQDHGIDNFIFTGWHDDPFAFLELMDITCLPSLTEATVTYNGVSHRIRGNEGFPTTHLEAMALAKPIIGTGIAGVPEQIIDQETGLLVDPGDANGLAEAINALVDNPELRLRLGKNGFDRVNSLFSIDQYVKSVSSLYDSMA
jgi:glycosyltransferase involved in cell wall biosynthesis